MSVGLARGSLHEKVKKLTSPRLRVSWRDSLIKGKISKTKKGGTEL